MRVWLLMVIVLPSATAQVFEISLEGDVPSQYVPGQATSVPLTLEVGCGLILPGGVTVDVETDLPPSWRAQPAAATFDAADCATGNQTAVRGFDLVIAPSPDALAVVKRSFTIYANATDAADSLAVPEAWIQYVAGHELTVDATTAEPWILHMTIRFLANGHTMLMFQNVQVESGTISGLGDHFFQPNQGDNRTQQVNATWIPARQWKEAAISFTALSHCLAVGIVCEDDHETVHEIRIVNPEEPSPAPAKKSPAPLAATAAGLLALVWHRRR